MSYDVMAVFALLVSLLDGDCWICSLEDRISERQPLPGRPPIA